VAQAAQKQPQSQLQSQGRHLLQLQLQRLRRRSSTSSWRTRLPLTRRKPREQRWCNLCVQLCVVQMEMMTRAVVRDVWTAMRPCG
jgi:hypothetical protein